MKFNCIAICITAFIITSSCKNNETPTVDVSTISVKTETIPFHQLFHQATQKTLPNLKKSFPYLFPSEVSDSIWLEKINSYEEKTLFKLVENTFGDFSEKEKEITELFKHVKYYNPKFKAPKIVTLITDLDYENPVVYADSLLFISLDMYLGSDSEVYKSFPKYISQQYTKEHLLVDIAKKINQKNFSYVNGRTFLESMIYKGKEHFLIKSMLPHYSDQEILGYAEDKFEWAVANESQIWSYFLTNELLYSTDQKLNNRFIDLAPFSKFYLQTDPESPGSIGVWIGYRIVKAYAENNNVSLQEILKTDAETIFKKSKFKPKK